MASQPPCRGRRPRRPANKIKTPPRPAPGKFRGTRPGLAATRRGRRPRRPLPAITSDTTSPHQPRRGRRPRRPALTVHAGLTTFPPRRGMLSRYITWHTGRLPPAVGVGVLDDPFLRPPPAPRRRAGAAGGGGRPQRGDPRRGSPLYPLLRFISTREFRALRRAARAPPLDPARFFVKKRGKKLLLG